MKATLGTTCTVPNSQLVSIARLLCIAKVVQGPAYSGLYRQVVSIARLLCMAKVAHGPAYSGLYRQLVLMYRWSLRLV